MRSLHILHSVSKSRFCHQRFYRIGQYHSGISHRSFWPASCSPSFPISAKSEMIHGDRYDILEKETGSKFKCLHKDASKIMHGFWISCGWLLPRNVNGDQLKLALQSALNVFPWISARITSIESDSFTMHCDNQGIRMDTVCHPSLSIHPADGIKYDELQRAVRPEHRNMFFPKDKPHLLVRKRMLQSVPIVNVQLNHLNVNNFQEITEDTPSILTFKY